MSPVDLEGVAADLPRGPGRGAIRREHLREVPASMARTCRPLPRGAGPALGPIGSADMRPQCQSCGANAPPSACTASTTERQAACCSGRSKRGTVNVS
ncbi:MAG: hypothetical protein R3F62_12765 [Planctomycetota bacterium]